MIWESATFKKIFDGNFLFFLLALLAVVLVWGYLTGHCKLCQGWTDSQPGAMKEQPGPAYVTPSAPSAY